MATVYFGNEDIVSGLRGDDTFSDSFLSTFEELNRSATRAITDLGGRFLERSRELRKRTGLDEIRRVARAARERIEHLWQDDTIRRMFTIEDLQNAPDKMVPWLMAHPEVRRRFNKGELDGYQDRYYDRYPAENPEEHLEYKAVMHGWQQDMHYTLYYPEEFEDDKDLQLTFEDKMAIRHSWDMIDVSFDARRDPTSKWDVSI